MELEKTYEPQRFESHWAEWRVETGIFHADPHAPGAHFSIAVPSPHVTGSMHIGHMLEHSLIDTATRWHPMRGDNTLFLPGGITPVSQHKCWRLGGSHKKDTARGNGETNEGTRNRFRIGQLRRH